MADRWQRNSDTDLDAPIEIGPQPDPMLGPGRASLLQECVVALAIVAVVTVVFYGLNRSAPEHSGAAEPTASAAPPAPQTTGQAPEAPPNAPAQPARPETPSPTGQGAR